jgi:hypothetical protein
MTNLNFLLLQVESKERFLYIMQKRHKELILGIQKIKLIALNGLQIQQKSPVHI